MFRRLFQKKSTLIGGTSILSVGVLTYKARNEYFNHEKAKILDKGRECSTCTKIRCYFNLRWWVCPNPDDKERSTSIEKQYNEGYYVNYEDYYIKEGDFLNSQNWNS